MTTNSFNNQNHRREFYLLPDLTQLNIVQGACEEDKTHPAGTHSLNFAVSQDSAEVEVDIGVATGAQDEPLPRVPKPPELQDDYTLKHKESFSYPIFQVGWTERKELSTSTDIPIPQRE